MHRIALLALLLVLVVSGIWISKNSTAFAGLRYSQATVTIPAVADVATYNIYYKPDSAKDYTHAVSTIPNTATAYTITYLRKGVNYSYYISYMDKNGNQHQLTQPAPVTNLQSMP